MSNRGRHKNNKHPLVKLLGIEITDKMMYYQIEQRNEPNLDVFMHNPIAGIHQRGFAWAYTSEGFEYWDKISEKIKKMICIRKKV